MSHLDPERLPLVALGDAPTAEEQEHLTTCDECALELAELEHTVAVGRSTAALGELESPPARVWDRIARELQLSTQEESSVPARATVDEPDPVEGDDAASRRPAWLVRTLLALAASVALVLVAVGTWTLVRPPESVEVASATLDPFPQHPGAEGTAVVLERPDGEREVTVELDAAAAGDGFREVWLITADASALVSLGVLEGREGTFRIPGNVDLRDYVLVDISQEPVDGDPAHSGDSIVRGELGFA